MKSNKLVVLCILLVAISTLVLGIVGYNAAEKAIYAGVDDKLQEEANDWRLLAESYERAIVTQEEQAKETAKDIVTAQAKITYELIQKSLDDNKGILSDSEKEDILNRLSKHTVGETGYIWILDYEGYYVLSKDRQRDGEYIWEAKDSDGNMVIQDLVGKGREVKGSEIAYHSYPWLNIGETEPREKIAAMVHFPEVEWVVGISTYYDDLVDMGHREKTMENVKDLMAQQVIGESGYIWVTDSNGVYVVSKNRLRDGEDISGSKDADGALFIQEAVKKAKAAGIGTDTQKYPWQNEGDLKPRMKVAGLSYMEEWDWVIGPSAYYDDFDEGSLGTVRNSLLTAGIVVLLIGAILAFVFAKKI
jgi:signal transduction histidine kinase